MEDIVLKECVCVGFKIYLPGIEIYTVARHFIKYDK